MSTYSLNIQALEVDASENLILNTNETVVYLENIIIEKTVPVTEDNPASSSCLVAVNQPDPLYNILCSWKLEELYSNFLGI